jgi:hypothetical protein
VVVNTYTRDGYVVADMLSHGFVLRQGNEVTHVFNDGFHLPMPGPESPSPRVKRCWICL